MTDRVTFVVAGADAYPAPLSGYDLVAFFDCLHDMGDPVGAIRHAAGSLTEDGTVLLVEPMAGERLEDNLNPVGRLFAGASVLICTPHAAGRGRRGPGHHRHRGGATRGGDDRRADSLPPRHRDTVQPRLRGAPLTIRRLMRLVDE